jgi:hypothetical protein
LGQSEARPTSAYREQSFATDMVIAITHVAMIVLLLILSQLDPMKSGTTEPEEFLGGG